MYFVLLLTFPHFDLFLFRVNFQTTTKKPTKVSIDWYTNHKNLQGTRNLKIRIIFRIDDLNLNYILGFVVGCGGLVNTTNRTQIVCFRFDFDQNGNSTVHFVCISKYQNESYSNTKVDNNKSLCKNIFLLFFRMFLFKF